MKRAMDGVFVSLALLALSLFVSPTGAAQVTSVSPQRVPFSRDSNTVLLLHLDGSLDDAGQGGLGVTFRGAGPRWADGRFGQALLLDGASVAPVSPSRLLYVGDRSWSVEVWIKPDRDQHQYATVFGGGWAFGRLYGLRIDDGKKLEAFFRDGVASPNASNSVVSADVSSTLFDGNWHQVAIVLDRSRHGEVRLYLDGNQLRASKAAYCGPMLMEDGTMGFAVGSLVPWDVRGGYRGLVDEVRVSDIVRSQYAAHYAIAPPQVPSLTRARTPFRYDAALSEMPLALTPERTLIVPHSVTGEGNTGNAAKLLQKYLRAVYGVTDGFAIEDQDSVASIDGKVVLALGDSKWADDTTLAKLPRFGYHIKRKANVVVMAGSNSSGTMAAALRFLDEFAGVRFYMPGELWTSIPVGRQITLRNIDETSAPFVVGLSMTGLGNVPGVGDWSTYNDVTRRTGGADQHNMTEMFPPARYAAKFPDIYPLLGGIRHIPQSASDQGWQPDFGASHTLDAAKESVTQFFKENPDYAYVAFGVMDGTKYDEGPASMAMVRKFEREYPDTMLARAHAYSAIYWDFINRLGLWMQTAEPGKLLMAQAYGLVRIPPASALSPNVMVVTVWGIAELDADKRLLPDSSGVSELQHWRNVASSVGNHDWMQGAGYYIPRSYTGNYSRYLKALSASGLQQSYQHLEAYPNWGLDGPKYYIVNRLMWDPGLNVDVLWKEFCDDMFGPASTPMQTYFRTLEQLWVQLDEVEGPERKPFRWSTQFKTTDSSLALVRAARTALDLAAGTAITDAQKQRIQLFSKTFHLSELLFDLAAEKAVKSTDIDQIRTYFAREIVPDQMTLYSTMRQPQMLDAAIQGAVGRRIAGH